MTKTDSAISKSQENQKQLKKSVGRCRNLIKKKEEQLCLVFTIQLLSRRKKKQQQSEKENAEKVQKCCAQIVEKVNRNVTIII